MGAPYHGKSGVVYMSTSASGTAASVLQLNAWSINRTTDKVEVSSFGDGNKVYVQGLPDLQGTLGGFWNDGESKPFTGAASTDGVKLYLYPSSNAPSKYWYGTAWLDVSMDTSASGAVALSGQFAAASSWGNTF
jgi:hypothetical protein